MEHPVPGTPRVLDIREKPDGWAVYFEFIPGITLAQRIRNLRFSPREARKFCLKLCSVLEKLHNMEIVHGDIKPENIIIAPDGEIYLIDLDAAHFVKTEIGRDTVMMGTPGFASPEQYGFGRSDIRSDIYAVGILLNVMITGQHPLFKTVRGRTSIVVERCTALEPSKRYQSVAELKKGLRYPARKHELWPVGFRSGNILHMLIALTGYVSVIGILIHLGIKNKGYSIMVAYMILLFVGTVNILFNYAGINEVFSRKPIVKFFTALMWLIFYFIMITLFLSFFLIQRFT